MRNSIVSLFLSYLLSWVALSLANSIVKDECPNTLPQLFKALRDLGYDLADAHSRSSIAGQGCIPACTVLQDVLGGVVSSRGGKLFVQQQSAYWSSQQAEVVPQCRVNPKSAKDVSAAILITRFYECPFAVKSGGHAAFAGASNIGGGMTIDLSSLRSIKISNHRHTTQVGAGNRWIDVYETLTPHNLSVVGGRVAGIGVGGLTLGGGISFFSGRHGFACDGVRNYEVVLASGRILNVNAKSHSDLYWALRGGGNNFGVVTRFDLETFKQGQMWGGYKVYPISANMSIFRAFDNFANNAPRDPDAAVILAFVYIQTQGQYLASNDYEYAKPVVNPPIFHEFTDIESIASTMRITNLPNLTKELDSLSPIGFRNTYTTATFRNSPVLQERILNIFTSEIDGIKDARNLVPALVFQPITKNIISYFDKNGGNALGIRESDGPLILMNLAISWSSSNDDERILAASNRIMDRSFSIGKNMNLDYKFLYQNYASLRQDVFASYGQANKKRLIKISKKYDPQQVFHRLQPGYFKLYGQNGGSSA